MWSPKREISIPNKLREELAFYKLSSIFNDVLSLTPTHYINIIDFQSSNLVLMSKQLLNANALMIEEF